MRSTSKIIAAIGVIAVMVGLGLWRGWFGAKPSVSVPGTQPDVSVTGTNTVPVLSSSKPPGTPGATALLPETAAASTNLITDWKEKIGEVMRSNQKPTDVGKKLLEMLPRMPAEGQIEASHHIANLLPDADYAPLGKVFADPKISEPLVEVLFADLLHRPNAIKLPTLLAAARTPGHPRATEAKDILKLHLEEDPGENWDKWQEKLTQWLKDHPVPNPAPSTP